MNIFVQTSHLLDYIVAGVFLAIAVGAILYVSDPQHVSTVASAKEMSYISSMVSDSDVKVAIDYEKKDFDMLDVKTDKNLINFKTDNDLNIEEEFIGSKITIEQKNKQVQISS